MLTRALSDLQRYPLKLYQIRSVKAIVVFMTVLNSDYLSIDSYEQEMRKFVLENKTEIRKPLHEWLLKIMLRESQSPKCADGSFQGVWNRREIKMTQPALPYDYTCFADGTSFVYEIFL